uniref:lysozyme n=1 Tax=Culicoides sonorensis TaxID=179676 RepID=A0A336LKI5_CULSO
MYLIGLIVILFKCFILINAKIYDRCELVRELVFTHDVSIQEAGIWACIAEGQSGYNTSALGGGRTVKFHGIFQISDEYWCSPPGKGWVCGVSCQDLRDNDISDDLRCAKNYIYEEHAKYYGDGFNAWPIYKSYCKANSGRYVIGCDLKNKPVKKKTTTTSKRPAAQGNYRGKVYEPCELANELLYKHHMAADQIATWVCIAKYESNFNTSAIGSGDYGLFQISELYWCGRKSRGKACDMACSDLLDDDISDDVKCMKRIFEEHTRLRGDGFKAWTVYERYCKNDVSKHIDHCFKKGLMEPEEHLLVVYKRPSKYYQQKTTKKFEYRTTRALPKPTTAKSYRTTTSTRRRAAQSNAQKASIKYNFQSSYNQNTIKSIPTKKKSVKNNDPSSLINFYLQYFNNRNLIS